MEPLADEYPVWSYFFCAKLVGMSCTHVDFYRVYPVF